MKLNENFWVAGEKRKVERFFINDDEKGREGGGLKRGGLNVPRAIEVSVKDIVGEYPPLYASS